MQKRMKFASKSSGIRKKLKIIKNSSNSGHTQRKKFIYLKKL